MSVMKRILRGLPRLRNAMLLGLAGLAARIPDDTPEVLEATISTCRLFCASQPALLKGCSYLRRNKFLISMLVWYHASSL